MVAINRTVSVDSEYLSELNGEITLGQLCRDAIKVWLHPDNADLRHSMRMERIREKHDLLLKEKTYVEKRLPLIEKALIRYEEMLKNEEESYEVAKRTTILNSYMVKISEGIILSNFDHNVVKDKYPELIAKIKELNPYFEIDPWIVSLKRDMY